MQIQKKLVSSVLSNDPTSPLLLEGYNFGYLRSVVHQEVKTSPTEPLMAFGGDGSATMDEIRDLISRLHKKGHARRYVLLEKTHKFRTDALNALLKLLEEPPQDTHIILTALPYATLATIRSRCSIVKFLEPSFAQVEGGNNEPHLTERFQAIARGATEDHTQLLEKFIVDARTSFLSEKSPERAKKKAKVIESSLRLLQKGVYSKVSLQNIFVMWNYA
jgi:hypothetical protein